MKTLSLTALLLAAAFSAFSIPVGYFPLFGPVNFKFTAYAQNDSFTLITSKTNTSTTVTNTVAAYKSTITNAPIGNAELLALLANSFQTNFPADSQLMISGTTIYVVAADGTTILQNASSVMSLHVQFPILSSGVETVTHTQDPNGNHSHVQDRETRMEVYELEYDDSALTTTDGTHTTVAFHGLMLLKFSRSAKTDALTTSFVINGHGSGTLRNLSVVLTGSVTGTGTLTP